MTTKQYSIALSLLRTKMAGLVGDTAGLIGRTTGHLWNAANAGAQATAGHLGSVGVPKALTGMITAAPTLAAGWGLQGRKRCEEQVR